MNIVKITALLLIVFSTSIIAQPQVSFTFDDGSTSDKFDYKLEDWNQMILDKLGEAKVKATLFSCGKTLQGKKGMYVFKSWNDAGHQIANHTYSHPNYSSEDVTIDQFKTEILKQDSIIAPYTHYTKLFRFPYLREGNTPEKVSELRTFLKEKGYRNGYVTIDDSDWYIDKKLQDQMKLADEADIDFTAYRSFYVNHIFEVAQRAETLAYELTGRNIKHTLLLHHNLVSALFLDAIMGKFQQEGWVLVSSQDAFNDPIYYEVPDFAGNGLLDAIAHDRQMSLFIKELDKKFNSYPTTLMDEVGLR